MSTKKKGNNSGAVAAKPPPPPTLGQLQEMILRHMGGDTGSYGNGDPLDGEVEALKNRREEVERQMELLERDEAHTHGKLQKIMTALTSPAVRGAIDSKVYDAPLREMLNRLKTTKSGWDSKSGRHVNNLRREGVVAWKVLKKEGASDEQIKANLKALTEEYPYEAKSQGFRIDKGAGMYEAGDGFNKGKQILNGERLIAETRRVLQIPQPVKKPTPAKKPVAPAKGTKPAAAAKAPTTAKKSGGKKPAKRARSVELPPLETKAEAASKPSKPARGTTMSEPTTKTLVAGETYPAEDLELDPEQLEFARSGTEIHPNGPDALPAKTRYFSSTIGNVLHLDIDRHFAIVGLSESGGQRRYKLLPVMRVDSRDAKENPIVAGAREWGDRRQEKAYRNVAPEAVSLKGVRAYDRTGAGWVFIDNEPITVTVNASNNGAGATMRELQRDAAADAGEIDEDEDLVETAAVGGASPAGRRR